MLRLKSVGFGLILFALLTNFSGCGPSVPVKDDVTLEREAKELDDQVKDGESGL